MSCKVGASAGSHGSKRKHGECVGTAVGGNRRAFQRVERDVDLGPDVGLPTRSRWKSIGASAQISPRVTTLLMAKRLHVQRPRASFHSAGPRLSIPGPISFAAAIAATGTRTSPHKTRSRRWMQRRGHCWELPARLGSDRHAAGMSRRDIHPPRAAQSVRMRTALIDRVSTRNTGSGRWRSGSETAGTAVPKGAGQLRETAARRRAVINADTREKDRLADQGHARSSTRSSAISVMLAAALSRSAARDRGSGRRSGRGGRADVQECADARQAGTRRDRSRMICANCKTRSRRA